jgi:hypothetical protein
MGDRWEWEWKVVVVGASVCEGMRAREGGRGRERACALRGRRGVSRAAREVGLDQFDAEEKEVEWTGRGLGRRCSRVAPATRRSIHVPFL